MPDARDLCLVSDVKALMQKSGANASAQDSLIQSLITDISCEIMEDWGREFVPGGPNSETFTNATRTFEFEKDIGNTSEVFVDLYPYDLQTTPAPTIVLDPDLSSPLTLTSTQWRLWPQPASKGVYEAIRLSLVQARAPWPWFTHRQVSVTGNWGFPSVPRRAKDACVQTVVHRITANPAARRADQVDAAMPGVTPRSYPMTAIDLLNSFKRMTI